MEFHGFPLWFESALPRLMKNLCLHRQRGKKEQNHAMQQKLSQRKLSVKT
jgi:hypothetical protein